MSLQSCRCLFVQAGIVALLLTGLWCAPAAAQGPEKDPVLIGLTCPLTGEDAYIGRDQLRGAELAVAELNRTGGLLGREVILVVEDDQGLSKQAVNVAHKLSANKDIIAVVGHLNSHCSISAAPVYARGNLAMLTPISTSDKLTELGLSNVFRVCIRNSDQAPALAGHCVSRLRLRRFAIIHDNRDYGKDLADQFKDVLSKLEAEVVGEDVISVEDSNYRTTLAKLKAKDPEALFFGGMSREAALLMMQSHELGLDVLFVAGDGVFSSEVMERAGLAAEGAVVSHIAPMPGKGSDEQEAVKEEATTLKGTAEESKAERLQGFFEEYQDRYGEPVRAYAPLSYDCIMAIAAAVRLAGSAERGKVIESLHSKSLSYHGLTGEIRFDEHGERVRREPYLFQIRDGRFVFISEP